MQVLGLIGIIVALVLFLFLVYKGCSSFWAAAVCAVIVAVTNGVNIVEAITGFTGADGAAAGYIPGIVNMISTMFSIIFLGAILGKLYTDTGAAASIAHVLTNAFVIKRKGKAQVRAAMIVLLVVAGLCTMGGIDGYVLTFTMFPICMVMAEMCDIPRRFVPGMFCLNCGFMIAPGAPQIYNVMASAAMGMQADQFGEQGAYGIAGQLGAATQNTAALVPGLVATAIVAVCGCATLIHMINKAKDQGEHFDYGTVEKMDAPDRKLPHFILAILPLVVVFVCYSIIHLDIFLALALGIIVAIVTMFRYIPPKKNRAGQPMNIGQRILDTVNGGANSFPNALMTVSTPAGLAGVITGTAAFGMVVGMLAGINVHPLLLTILVVCVIVAITSAPPVALMVAFPIVIGILAGPAIGMAADAASAVLPFSAQAIYRVGVVAASTFETLPFNGLIVLGLGLTHCTHKESYKPMFLMTVVYTFAATIVCALLCLIPGLA